MPCKIIPASSKVDFLELRDHLAGREDPGEESLSEYVRKIIADVSERGDASLVEYEAKFDSVSLQEEELPVSRAELTASINLISQEDLTILKEAAVNIRAFHERQNVNSWWTDADKGSILGQIVRPVDRAGLYIPGGIGGDTPLISSLLMNAIPAQVAGVPEIALISPPRPDGTLNPYILATAKILGLNEIYKVGSAWGVAALALGTKSIQPVDVIAGPGNMYVTEAKRQLFGKVGIDMLAGPSEIFILADEKSDPDWIAADMLSQAEHDSMASSVVALVSEKQAGLVLQALKERLEDLPRKEIARRSLADWGAIVIVDNLEAGIELANILAPEHFELSVEDPWRFLGKIRNAGALFLGRNCPEAVGDYFAGPNHVLPVLGTARFSQALSVSVFQKRISLTYVTDEYIHRHGQKIARMARLEGLEAHARSAESRLDKTTEGR